MAASTAVSVVRCRGGTGGAGESTGDGGVGVGVGGVGGAKTTGVSCIAVLRGISAMTALAHALALAAR